MIRKSQNKIRTLAAMILIQSLLGLFSPESHAAIVPRQPWIMYRNCSVVAIHPNDVTLDCPASGGMAHYPRAEYTALLGEPEIGDQTGESKSMTITKKLKRALASKPKPTPTR